jgi:hypothetical protein
MHVFFRRCIDQKQAETTGISVAAVDCNPEALGIYHQQLSILAKISIDRYLLDELRKRKNVDRLLGQYDILLTTSNHINELQDLVPSLHKRCFPVAVAPTRKTLIALAKIPTDKRVGVFYRSRRFLEIIGVWLKRSGFFENFSSRSCENINSEQLISFVQDCDYLVVPPDFLDSLEAKCRQNLKMLKAEIIDFAYQIERGSLLHLEDTIKNIMNKSGTKP